MKRVQKDMDVSSMNACTYNHQIRNSLLEQLLLAHKVFLLQKPMSHYRKIGTENVVHEFTFLKQTLFISAYALRPSDSP